MTYSLKSKVLAASALSLLLLTSCGEPPINKDADPATVLKDARAHFVTSASTLLDRTASGSQSGTIDANYASPDGNVKLSGKMDTVMTKAKELGLMLDLDAEVSSDATGKITGSLTAELRFIAKMFYVNIMDLVAKADQPALQTEIDNSMAMTSMFTDKWLKFDLVKLAAMGGGDSAALEQAFNMQSAEQSKKLIAKLNENEIFTVKEKLAPQDGMYVYKVVPNKEGVTAFVQAVLLEVDPAAQLTPDDKAGLDQVLTALSSDNVVHTLYIDGDMNYRKFVSTGTINSAEAKADITSTITLDKDLNGTWVVDVKANNPAGSESMTFSFKAESKNLNGTAELKFDAPFMKTTFSLNTKSTFTAGDKKVETPADAVDFLDMMGGGAAVAPTATGAKLPAANQ